jgi:hypothetical protein
VRAARVVLEDEQVLCILGHVRPSCIELWAHELTGGHKALMPLGLLLITDRKERDQRVGGVSEVSLTQGGECHVRHLLDGVIDLTTNDDSRSGHHAVDGYLHPDLTTHSGHGPERVYSGRRGSSRRSRGGRVHSRGLTETTSHVGPWYEDIHPHRGSSGGNHPCSSVRTDHENITNPM